MNSFKRVAIKDLMVEMKKIKVKADAVDNLQNTSLAAKGAFANRLHLCTACNNKGFDLFPDLVGQ